MTATPDPETPTDPRVDAVSRALGYVPRDPIGRRRATGILAAADAATDAVPWCVYEWAEGTVYGVTPASQERAEREAQLVGDGHEAMPREVAERLRNAHAHGRMQGHRQAAATGTVPVGRETLREVRRMLAAVHRSWDSRAGGLLGDLPDLDADL